MVGGNDDDYFFLRRGNRAKRFFVSGFLDRFACVDRNAVFFLRALFRLDRAVLVVSQPRQILDGNFIVDQNLDRSRAVQLLQRVHCLDHGQRASVAQSIDQNHDNTSSNLLFKKFLLF